MEMKATSPRYVNLYTEANPNPNSMKFVVNYMLTADGESFDFPDPASAEKAPLAKALFENYSYVERVFVTSNFVTVTKSTRAEWEEVIGELKVFIKQWLEDDKLVIDHSATMQDESLNLEETAIEAQIKSILDEYVRPAVESDGGAITFHSFNEGVVKVQLQGSCSGCPSSTITLKAGIENLLKRMMPNDVTSVEAEGI